MKIAYLAAGAAGMVCGSCLHDNTLCAAMIEEGEEVLLIPLYTPLKTDEQDVSQDQVFFGGVNLYLREKSALFRALPAWSTRWLDQPSVLNFLTKRAGGNDPSKLGPLTISMLEGEQGLHRTEIERIANWLATEVKPTVLHLSNVLLTGMAPQLKQTLGVPLVCSLGGEDGFVEKIAEPHRSQVIDLLRDRCRSIDAFVALNHYYADRMSEYLAIDRAKIEVIPHGLRLEDFPAPGDGSQLSNRQSKTVGFLARVCPDKGLRLLAEAFIQLAAEADLPDLRLQAAGYLSSADRGYLADIQELLAKNNLASRFEYLGELDHAEKVSFLQSLDVMALPTLWPEAKGLPMLESLAAGTPVVVPDHGSFPELIQDTGGGLLHRPGEANSLADCLRQLLLAPETAAQIAETGQKAVHERYRAAEMAQSTRALYQRITSPGGIATTD